MSEIAVCGYELVGRVRLVAGRDRRVRREHDPLASCLERRLQTRPGCDLVGRELERRQGRVSLVEMQDRGPDVESAQDAHAAEAEQTVLRKADRPARLVQAAGRPSLNRVVLRHVGVEE